MADFDPQIVDQVLAACQKEASEAASALSTALDTQIELSVGDPTSLDVAALPEDLRSAGLAIVLKVGQVAALGLLTESSGLLPPWYTEPDATGKSRLATLAQELGFQLLPEDFMPEEFLAEAVSDLSAALYRGDVAADAGHIPLNLSSGDKQGVLHLIWPAANPDAVFETPEPTAEESETAAEPESAAEPAAEEPQAASPEAAASGPMPISRGKQPYPTNFSGLPHYGRSLLQVKVPVVVTLASKKQRLEQVVNFGLGSILQFSKSCEETLELEIGDQPIAEGEAVKVGDKFGLRITSMTLPDERFFVVKGRRDD